MEFLSFYDEDIALFYDDGEEDKKPELDLSFEYPDLITIDMSKLQQPLNRSGKTGSPFSPFRVIPPISPPPKDNGLMITNSARGDTSGTQKGFGSQASVKSRDSARSNGKPDSVTAGRRADGRPSQRADTRKNNSVIPKDHLDESVKLIGYKLTNQNSSPPQPANNTTSKWVPPGSELPPCKICADKSSGLHYGVYTCEACKAFFRRSLKRASVDFQCTCSEAERRKNQEGPRKTTCPKCRYDRCIKEGMSVDAIKIGRYSITRKRQNDREVNLLKEKTQQKSQDNQTSSESSPSTSKSSPDSSPYSSGQSVRSPEQITSDITSLNIDGNSNSAKKMRPDPDPTTGMLYQSLQNSIIEAIKATTSLNMAKMMDDARDDSMAGLTPIQQLFMQPFDPNASMGTDGNGFVSPADQFAPSTDTLFQFGASVDRNNIITFTGQPMVSYDNQHIDESQTAVLSQPMFMSNPTTVDSSMYLDSNTSINATAYQSTAASGAGNTDADKIMELFMTAETSLQSNQPSSIEDLLRDPLQEIPPPFTVPHTIQSVSQGKHIYTTSDNMGVSLPTDIMTMTSPGLLPCDEVENNDHIQDECMNSAIEKLIEESSTVPCDDFVQTLVDAESSLIDLSQFDAAQIGDMPVSLMEVSQNNNTMCPAQSQIANKFDTMMWREKVDTLETEQELENLANLEEALNNDQELYPVLIQNCEDATEFMTTSLRLGVDVSVEDIQATIKELWDCTKLLDQMRCNITCAEIRKRHADYLEKYRQKMELLGNLGNISTQEYLEVYRQTGIELDDRKQIVVDFLQYTEGSIHKMILFVKCIPGFTELCYEDQATLLKAARFEQGMIKVMNMCPITNEITTMPWKKEYHVEEIAKVFPKDFLMVKRQVMGIIQNLKMTEEEAAIMRALAICCPQRPGLMEIHKVQQVFDRMLLCLHHLLDKRGPEKLEIMSQICKMFGPLRKLSDWEHKLLAEFFEVWPVADTQNHSLVKQFVE